MPKTILKKNTKPKQEKTSKADPPKKQPQPTNHQLAKGEIAGILKVNDYVSITT